MVAPAADSPRHGSIATVRCAPVTGAGGRNARRMRGAIFRRWQNRPSVARMRCVALLAAIGLATLLLGTISWWTLVDQHVHIGPAPARPQSTAGPRVATAPAPASRANGSSTIHPPTGSAASGTPGGRVTTSGGPLIASAGVLLVLSAGSVACLVVWKRFVRNNAARVGAPAKGSQDAQEHQEPVDLCAPHAQVVPAETAEQTAAPHPGVPTAATPVATGLPVQDSLVGSFSHAVPSRVAPDADGVHSARETPADRGAGTDDPPVRAGFDDPGLMLFDRRGALRVPFAIAANLQWDDFAFDVTTSDLSTTGLSCHLATCCPVPPPSLRNDVVLLLPLRGQDVTIEARVMRKVQGVDDVTLGLQFLAVEPQVSQLLHETVIAVSEREEPTRA